MIQTLYTNTKATTESLKNDAEITVLKILIDVGFHDKRPKSKSNKSARLKDITDNLPKAIEYFLSLPLTLPALEDKKYLIMIYKVRD